MSREFSTDREAKNANGNLSLWSSKNRGPAQATHAYELQLLNLPSLRNTVGLLQSGRCSSALQGRRDGDLFVGS